MAANPIKYKDLVEPDSSIRQAIQELTELRAIYVSLQDAVKNNAITLQAEVRKSVSTTKEGREEVEKLSYAAKKLKRAQEELDLAMSDTGRTIQSLKNQTREYNEVSKQRDLQTRNVAGSYNDLKAKIKLLTDEYKSLSREEANSADKGQVLLSRILELKTELKQYNDELKLHVERQKQVKQQVSLEEKARARLRAALDGTVSKLAALNREADIETKKAKLQAVINSEKEGSYNRLSAQYSLNKIKLNAMSQAERETTESGKALVRETYEIYQAMIKAQEATGKYTLSVGNYKKHWDGFAVAVNQVIREVPAAAISLNTFFLGISNNVPLLVDELQRLRNQNKMLAAEGKPQVSIFKQLMSSVFSFNTLLIAGLTILAMHGEDIVKWAKELITGRKAVLSTNEAIEQMNKSLKEGTGDYGKALVNYKRLQDEWKDLKTLKERQEWIQKNEDAFRQLDVAVTNVNEADNVFIRNTEAMKTAMRERAKAAAAEELATKKYQEAFAKREEAKLEEAKSPSAIDKTKGLATVAALLGPLALSGLDLSDTYSGAAATAQVSRVKSLNEEAAAAEADADKFYELADSYRDAAKAALDAANIDDYIKRKKGRQPKDATDYLDKTETSVQKEYAKSNTALEQKQFEQRRKEAIDTYNAETAALYDKYNKLKRILDNESKEYKALSDEQIQQATKTQDTIVKTIENKQLELKKKIEDIETEKQIFELNLLKETIDLRLQAVQKGSEEELSLRLKSLEAQRQVAILQNNLKPAGERVSNTDILGSFNTQANLETGSYKDTQFAEQQELESARFNIVKRSELEITKFKLQQEKDRWEQQIALAESGGLNWSNTQIETAKALVQGLERELSELSGFSGFVSSVGSKGLGGALLGSLGFDDDAISAMNDATSIILNNLQEIAQAEVDAAQAAVDAANERVEAARSAYEAEIEARNNGYANNVATAKKEYEQEKRKQQQKKQLLEQAQKRQEQLNTITQASSLITASANIWSSMSSIPIVGPALALAAIASMWTSFAIAKVKAKQVTAQADEYGDGGLEFLEGGSHASGNDIDLGVKNRHKHKMKAEGGEALAIINKRQTRKYRKELPAIIDSLNKGTFEDKYLKAFSHADNVSITQVSNFDTTKLEYAVEQIRHQIRDSRKIYYAPNGNIIETRGNVTRIIK